MKKNARWFFIVCLVMALGLLTVSCAQYTSSSGGCMRTMINGQNYYVCDGEYYKEHVGGYGITYVPVEKPD